jgi:single-stranded-DNA-specific exonuclease
MRFVWSTAVSQPAQTERLALDAGISTLLARCLLNRGISNSAQAKAYLEPLLANLSDPFEMEGMRAAVLRLFKARENGERLVIFGDYDVDGVTSTTLLTEVVAHLGWNVDAYLPHRLDEGYGLTGDAVENCLRKLSPNLLLAVDCGSTSNDVIHGLQESAIDVIVLDHHQPSCPPPAAHAIINPHLRREPGPALGLTGRAGDLKELCSVGLSFKLAHAIIKHARTLNLPEATPSICVRYWI